MKIKLLFLIVSLSVIFSISVHGQYSHITKVPDKTDYLLEITGLLEMRWPENRTVNIVCHGHSVPAGYFKTPVVDTFNAYPHLLHRELKNRFPYAVINVIVTGIGGETSDLGAKRFEKEVLCHNPDIITIDYALNDRLIGLEKARLAWSAMIEAAKARGIKVILLTPTPDLKSDMNDPHDDLNRHAEQIRNMANHYNVALVDNLTEFNNYVKGNGKLEELMSQRNHPNRKGHELVVKKLMEWFPE